MEGNTGKPFEKLTEDIYKKLLRNSKFETIEPNKIIDLGDKGRYQFDLVLTTKTAGLELMTVIECKDYKRPVDRAVVNEFYAKMLDVKANKGVIVTSKGYRKAAQIKAKDYGISLYTAHQAKHPKWNIDIEIPIIVKEISPTSFRPRITFPQTIITDFVFNRSSFIVNDIDLFALFKEQWHKNQFKFEITEEPQIIQLLNFYPPYSLRDAKGKIIPVKTIDVELELTIDYYLGSVSDVENTQLLKGINEQSTFFIDTQPILNYKTKFRKVRKSEIPDYNKLILNVTTFLKILKSEINSINSFE